MTQVEDSELVGPSVSQGSQSILGPSSGPVFYEGIAVGAGKNSDSSNVDLARLPWPLGRPVLLIWALGGH